MALAAADMGFFNGALCFGALCRDLHPPLKSGAERATNRRVQLEILAGVGAQDRRDRARSAKLGGPNLAACFEQAALL